MKLAIYVRVSTDEQAEFGISLADQHQRGIEHAQKLGWEYEIFEDAGLSGKLLIDKRPALKRLINHIQTKEINGVYVANWDRLSRNDSLSPALKLIFKEKKVRLFENSGETNLNDISQELLLDVKSLLSVFEVKQTGKRISDKLVHNIKQGKVAGGQLQPYGFTKGADKKLIIDEKESEIVKEIFNLFLSGKGTKVISNILNERKIPTKMSSKNFSMIVKGKKKTEFVWRDAVIYNILKNPIYKGKRLYKEVFYDVPNIISPQVFDVVQSTLKNKRQFTETTNKYFYLLKGLIHCSCGCRFYGHKRESLKDNHYMCSSQRHKGEGCGTRGVGIDFLDELIWKQVLTLPKQVDDFFIWFEQTDEIKKTKDYVSELDVKKSKLQSSLNKLVLLSVETDNNQVRKVYESQIAQQQTEIDNLNNRINNIAKQLSLFNDKENIIKFISMILKPTLKKTITDDEKRNIIRSLVDDISVAFFPEIGNHIINMKYKIDELTQVKLLREIEFNRFKRSGDNVFKNTLMVDFLYSEKGLEEFVKVGGRATVSVFGIPKLSKLTQRSIERKDGSKGFSRIKR